MENYTRIERERYNEYREQACASLGITKNQYNWLRRQAERLHKFDEWTCNGTKGDQYMNGKMQVVPIEYTDLEYMADCADVYEKIIGIFTKLYKGQMRYFYHQTDPRGVSLYLDTDPITGNNYTNAVAIY